MNSTPYSKGRILLSGYLIGKFNTFHRKRPSCFIRMRIPWGLWSGKNRPPRTGISLNGHQVIHVQQYRLSKPDSCGMQFIESLTQAEIRNHTEIKETARAKAETVTSAQEQHTQYRERQTESDTSSADWRYQVTGIIVALGLLFYFHKRGNTTGN